MDDKNDKIRSIIKSVIGAASSMSTFGVKLDYNSTYILNYITQLRNVTTALEEKFREVADEQVQIMSNSENIASLIENTTTNVERVAGSAAVNTSTVESASTQMLDLQDHNKYVVEQMEALEGVIKEIQSAIKGINQISVQSRMLSINASVEAARAGAAGKGFGVVAQEMQSLSVNTNKFVTLIESLLDSINKYSSETKNSLNKSSRSVNDMEKVLTNLVSSIKDTELSMSEISDNIKNISSITEEFSVTTQTTTESINDCLDKVNVVRDVAVQFQNVHKSITELERDFENSEKIATDSAQMLTHMDEYPEFKLTNEDFIQILNSAITAHKNWVDTVRGMIDKMTVLPLQTDGHKCGFGHYYYVLRPKNKEILEVWRTIESIHNSLHACGKDVIKYIESNDSKNASMVFQKIVNYSDEIGGKLRKLVEMSSNRNIKVFEA